VHLIGRLHFVSSVYHNLLNRGPDPEGLDYWVGELESGASTPGLLIGNLINAAMQADSTDWMIIRNKVLVAGYFARRFHDLGLSWQESDLVTARQVLDGVTADQATVSAGKDSVDLLVQ
jgi:hypothetical protein